LPPNLPADPDALDACLREFSASRLPADTRKILQDRIRVAVELRHDSWWTDEIRQLLERHRAALCWADRHGSPVTPLWRTADWGYLRLHEGAGQPWPRYTEPDLRAWVRRVADAWPADADVFAYFNNDQGAAALYDAAAFASLAREAGLDAAPTATPGTPGTTPPG
jgi:uncharacterized protein YecE (DUF72 family)